MRTIVCLLLVLPLTYVLRAQTGLIDSTTRATQAAESISDRSLHAITNKYIALTDDTKKSTSRLLISMQQKELALQKKLNDKDSLKAQQVFAGVKDKYQQMESGVQSPLSKLQNYSSPLKQYIPGLDSISTLMHFLSSSNSVSSSKLAQIQNINNQLQQLQGRLQQANDVQDYVQQREQLLRSQLDKYNLANQLTDINKSVFYYQQQLQNIKGMINDKKKLEQEAFNKIRSLPAFQHFMQKNSTFARLFPMPASPNADSTAMLTGLQTRAQIQNHVKASLPSNAGDQSESIQAPDPGQYIQKQVDQAQGQLNSLRDKISGVSSGSLSSSSSMTMPDFAPNDQHTKSIWKRLIYGINLQTESSTTLLPAVVDLGLSIGYKLSSKAVIGSGVSYKLGLPVGAGHTSFTSQGIELRSYLDIKAKGNLWITGGYEYNYLQAFTKLNDLRNVQAWQKSALLGLTQKYKVGKRQGNVQLLYDLLYSTEIPQARPLVFRVGYSF